MKTGLMKKREDAESGGEIDLTPMLDVVFILLIFFIVTSVFVTEAGIDVLKPEASTAEARNKDLILIAISSDGQIWIDGEQIDPRFIRSRFERRLAETPNASVVIQGDRAAQNEQVMSILRAARDANIAAVSISTEN
ncbi:MAG: biopolymer transporter ExbD [Pseudohongiella sp.]|nr:biopolymer transporter ExbD [Pseudohongiella sp.]MDP2126301.1 biopolymer transporter ExbD [Pseudohongiella sp.]